MNPESSTPSLPIEVWGQIFENIDNPLDLMRARKVCKQWNEEINRVMPFANWKKLCLNEIRASSLSSIVAVVQPTLPKTNYREIEDQYFWRQVYYHYKKWLKIKELLVRVFSPKNYSLLSTDEYITCFDTWDDWIMYGTNYGKIHIFESFKHKTPYRIQDCRDKIQGVKFWYNANDSLLFLVLTQSRLIKMWDLADRIASSFVLPGYKMCVGTANNLYSLFDHFLMKIESTSQNIRVKSMLRLDLISGEQVVAMNSRESKIFIVTQAMMKLRVFTIEDESFTEQGSRFRVQSILIAPSLPLVPSNVHVYVTLNRTIICTQNGHVCFHTPKTDFWVTHDKPMYFNADVRSLIVHGNYLIIGLSNGILCMYYAEGIGDLMRPNLFRRKPVKMFSLDTLPIIAIKVTDLYDVIQITAFNSKNMFVLRF